MIRNVGIVLFCSIVTKLLSYLWESTLAALFGASAQADAFYMMYSILLVIYPVLDSGIWKVFMPIYKTKLLTDKAGSAERFANISLCFFLLLAFALVILLSFFSEQIVMMFAPGFSAEQKAVTAGYLRVASFMLALMPSTSVLAAVLQSRSFFFASQLREIATHVSRIVFLLLFYQYWGIMAAVFALIVGSVFRLLVQLPFLNRSGPAQMADQTARVNSRAGEAGWRFRPDFHFHDPDIVRMLRGLPSVSLTAAITYVNGLVDKMIASGAGRGAIACLNYGHKLFSVFNGMISTAIGTATYPTMIQYIAERKEDKLRELVGGIIGVFAFLIIPISLFCTAFSRELVVLAFQRGAFDSAATDVTAAVFLGYSLGMLFEGITTVISNVFYGYGDTRTTMRLSAFNVTLNIGLNLLFVRFWGVAGLALATSLSTAVTLVIRLTLLKRYILLDYRKIALETIKIFLISVVAVGLAVLLFKRLFSLPLLLSVLGGAAVIALCGIALSVLLRVNAASMCFAFLLKKIRRDHPA